MSSTEEEKTDWGERVELHLLDGIHWFELKNIRSETSGIEDGRSWTYDMRWGAEADKKAGWVWVYDEQWDGHRIEDDITIYQSQESLLKRLTFLMRNSPKYEYAKTMATEAVVYNRNLKKER